MSLGILQAWRVYHVFQSQAIKEENCGHRGTPNLGHLEILVFIRGISRMTALPWTTLLTDCFFNVFLDLSMNTMKGYKGLVGDTRDELVIIISMFF